MGLFSAIGSFVSSACSAISSVCSSIGSAIGSVCSSIGGVSALVATISTVLSVIPGLQSAAGFLRGLATVARAVAVVCNVLSPHEDMEDLGERALQANDNDITLEKCGNDFNVYMEKLRSMELDPNKMHTQEERLLAGVLVAEQGIKQANPELSTKYLTPLMLLRNGFVTEEKVQQWGKIAESMGYSFADVAKFYLGDRFNAIFEKEKGNKDHGYTIVEQAEKDLHPDKSTADILNECSQDQKDFSSIFDKLKKQEQ